MSPVCKGSAVYSWQGCGVLLFSCWLVLLALATPAAAQCGNVSVTAADKYGGFTVDNCTSFASFMAYNFSATAAAQGGPFVTYPKCQLNGNASMTVTGQFTSQAVATDYLNLLNTNASRIAQYIKLRCPGNLTVAVSGCGYPDNSFFPLSQNITDFTCKPSRNLTCIVFASFTARLPSPVVFDRNKCNILAGSMNSLFPTINFSTPFGCSFVSNKRTLVDHGPGPNLYVDQILQVFGVLRSPDDTQQLMRTLLNATSTVAPQLLGGVGGRETCGRSEFTVTNFDGCAGPNLTTVFWNSTAIADALDCTVAPPPPLGDISRFPLRPPHQYDDDDAPDPPPSAGVCAVRVYLRSRFGSITNGLNFDPKTAVPAPEVDVPTEAWIDALSSPPPPADSSSDRPPFNVTSCFTLATLLFNYLLSNDLYYSTNFDCYAFTDDTLIVEAWFEDSATSSAVLKALGSSNNTFPAQLLSTFNVSCTGVLEATPLPDSSFACGPRTSWGGYMGLPISSCPNLPPLPPQSPPSPPLAPSPPPAPPPPAPPPAGTASCATIVTLTARLPSTAGNTTFGDDECDSFADNLTSLFTGVAPGVTFSCLYYDGVVPYGTGPARMAAQGQFLSTATYRSFIQYFPSTYFATTVLQLMETFHARDLCGGTLSATFPTPTCDSSASSQPIVWSAANLSALACSSPPPPSPFSPSCTLSFTLTQYNTSSPFTGIMCTQFANQVASYYELAGIIFAIPLQCSIPLDPSLLTIRTTTGVTFSSSDARDATTILFSPTFAMSVLQPAGALCTGSFSVVLTGCLNIENTWGINGRQFFPCMSVTPPQSSSYPPPSPAPPPPGFTGKRFSRRRIV